MTAEFFIIIIMAPLVIFAWGLIQISMENNSKNNSYEEAFPEYSEIILSSVTTLYPKMSNELVVSILPFKVSGDLDITDLIPEHDIKLYGKSNSTNRKHTFMLLLNSTILKEDLNKALSINNHFGVSNPSFGFVSKSYYSRPIDLNVNTIRKTIIHDKNQIIKSFDLDHYEDLFISKFLNFNFSYETNRVYHTNVFSIPVLLIESDSDALWTEICMNPKFSGKFIEL